ncbi:MAG: type II secretion system protein N [Burkholderiaceae bacterium]
MKRTVGAGRWPLALASFLAVALLCGLATYWAMQLLAPRVSIAPSGSLVNTGSALDIRPAGRLFGVAGQASNTIASPLPSNIKVLGLIAAASRAAVILQIDNQPATAYGVNDSIGQGMTVKSVSREEVVIERNGELLRAPAPELVSASLLGGGPAPDSAAGLPATPAVPAPAARMRPNLPQRSLPPAGAAAAASAAGNTTGLPVPATGRSFTAPSADRAGTAIGNAQAMRGPVGGRRTPPAAGFLSPAAARARFPDRRAVGRQLLVVWRL